jgi:arylsulfatase A-like enzyme
MPDRPHILWLCTDSQRWDTLGCYGNPHVRTPHLDALAGRGTRYDLAIAQNPLCTPSRGSFLTGRYPSATGLVMNGQRCPADLRPIPARFRDAGYRTGLVGKLHLTACDQRFRMGERWWDYGPREWAVGVEPRFIDDGYQSFEWDHAARTDDPSSAYSRWLDQQDADPPETPTVADRKALVQPGMPEPLHQTTWCVERAIDFIGADPSSAWFASINFFDPHYKFNPPPELLAGYRDRLARMPLPRRREGELDHLPAAFGKAADRFAHMTDDDHRLAIAAYYAMIDLIDRQVGRLLEHLDATGQLENTLVVFMSDHGEMLGDHGLYTKDAFLYDPAVRVPLILAGPGVPAGQVVDAPVELVDLAPTLLDAAGLSSGPHHMHGRSLLATGTGRHDPPRTDAFAEFHNATPDGLETHATMIRTRGAKLVIHDPPDADPRQPIGELYDLTADPHELHNRFDDPQYAELKIELLTRLALRQQRMASPLPARIGAF